MTPDTAPMALRRRREGFLLPMVLLSLLLVASLTAATQLGAWRATRAARLAWNGERATHAADEAIAAIVSDWDPGSFAARAIGERWNRSIVTADGVEVDVALVRTAPLVLMAMARATSRVSGAPDTASRRVARAIGMLAPAFPLRAAVTVTGVLALQNGASVDGRDGAWSADGCGTTRDTLSIAGVHAGAVTAAAGASILGLPPVIAPGIGAAVVAADAAAFERAWEESRARATVLRSLAAGAAVGTPPPWQAVRVVSADSSAASAIVLGGVSAHDGLLLVDGNLVVTGSLVVRGLLAVRGTLDVTAGSLDVLGAVIVRGEPARESQLGAATRVRFSPCAARRALAAVSRPGIAPFGHWIAR